MINIADLPAVRAQLEQDAATAEQAASSVPAVSLREELAEMQPEPTPSYPSKSLVLVDGRYQAVKQKN
jgi:hypothetical protein